MMALIAKESKQAAKMDATKEVLFKRHRQLEQQWHDVGRSQQLRVLLEHYQNPRHQRVQDGTDVALAGGGTEQGDAVVVYLKGNGCDGIQDVSFTGEGDLISMGATSVLMELVHDGGLTMDEVLTLDNEGFLEGLGREAVGARTRQATLGLSTLKHAVRTYQRDRPESGHAPDSLRAADPSGSRELVRRQVCLRRLPGGR
jgi:nitrogen fixation protein NifU and related proteins